MGADAQDAGRDSGRLEAALDDLGEDMQETESKTRRFGDTLKVALAACSRRTITLRSTAGEVCRGVSVIKLALFRCASPGRGTHGGRETAWQTKTLSCRCGRFRLRPCL